VHRAPDDAAIVIDAATPRDLAAVRRLLERHQLPLEGVDERLPTMIVARDAAGVVGIAALELYADGALLRSVAVDPARQRQRLGHRLTEAALRMAREHRIETVVLLTTTAERFFPKFGFEPITRADVPASVQTSVEFRSACPASAVVMRKRLSWRRRSRGTRMNHEAAGPENGRTSVRGTARRVDQKFSKIYFLARRISLDIVIATH
jgi:amino-acid N-acetyltransferase